MYFFFDESGDFAVPENPSIHRCAVTMGIAVSDRVFDELRGAFARFVATLQKGELVDGEPKGRLLTYAHKKDFCDILARYEDGISVTPVTLDLSSLSLRHEGAMTDQMYELLSQWAEKMLHPEARAQLQLLARQYRNLSVSQGLRIYSLANCIREALETAIVFLSNRGHENAWGSTLFEVDRVQTRVGNREETVFSLMVLSWLSGWSQRHPMPLVTGIHTEDHPFVKNYDTPDGIDIGKLVRGRIRWVDSRESWGVQMADIGATIVSQAAYALDDRYFSLRCVDA
jgi:hypothetical protein